MHGYLVLAPERLDSRGDSVPVLFLGLFFDCYICEKALA